ncbi:MAG: GHKL domain-containing protein [Bacilli bacterium]
MSLTDYVYMYPGFLVTIYFVIKNYQTFNKDAKKILTIKNIFIILFFSFFGLINSIYNVSVYRCIFSLLIQIFLNLLIFKEKLSTCFFKTITLFTVLLINEMIFSVLIFKFSNFGIQDYLSHKLLLLLFSTFLIIISYLEIKIVYKRFIATRKNNEIKKIFKIITLLFFVFIMLLTYKNMIVYNISNYYINIFLFIILSLIISIVLYQWKKIADSRRKSDIFLDFLKTYEIKAELDSEFRHELLNNLLIIKSMKKNADIQIVIDEIIKKYDTNKMNNFKNISKLPKGIKGVIYYKVFEMENQKAKVELNISTKVEKLFNYKEAKEYKDIIEILTILLDNATDAISKEKTKSIVINIYKKDNDLIIEVSNTYRMNVNINKIDKLGYSTKGKNRGIGLYVAKNIINGNKNFDLKQYVEDQRFYSIFTIKCKLFD